MAQLFEKSLEDIIQQDRGGGGGRRGGRGGPQRRRKRRRRTGARMQPYSADGGDGDIDQPWQHDLYDDDEDMGVGPASKRPRRRRQRTRTRRVDTAVEVRVDNLDYAAVDEDLEDLVRRNWTGGIRSARVNYDASGRSKESGVIVFDRMSDAQQAVQALDRVEYKGRVLRFTIEPPKSRERKKPSKNIVIAASRPGERTIRAQGGGINRGGRGPRGGRGGSRRRARRRRPNKPQNDDGGVKSMEELNNELEQLQQQ